MPRLREEPLPGFVTAAETLAAAAEALRPPRRMSVSEWAEAHRQLRNPGAYSGPWRNAKTPYLVEIMDRTESRAVEVVAVAGPSQFGKTDLGLNVIGHAAMCRPRDILAVQYSREMAIDFFNNRIDAKLIRPCRDLARLLGKAHADNKVMEKRFATGMRVVAGWPVPGQLASRPVPLGWLDERDRMADDVGGEGDPVELVKKRGTTFGKNAVVLVTSSPTGLHPEDGDKDVDDVSPILVLVLQGDFNLWHWPCLDCGEYWTPGFDGNRRPTVAHLWIPDGATPEEARERATLVCPHCGAETGEDRKHRMNARGVWVPRGMTLDADGEMRGSRPATRTASYWFCGLASPFRTIGQIAEELVRAESHWRATRDEALLKTCFNTALGFPYRPRAAGALPLEAEALRDRRGADPMGVVPAGVRFLTAAVDIKTRGFAVAVLGWDADARSWLVDRFDIDTGPDGAELDPANVAAHWGLLTARVLNAAYPLAEDAGREMPVAAMALDTGGAAGEEVDGDTTGGVTLQARNYARRLFAAGEPLWRLTLVKGASTRTAPMLPVNPTWESDDKGKRLPDAVPLYVIGVHAIKNVIDNRLRLPAGVEGAAVFAADTPDAAFKELCAERKVKGKWHRRGRNETWDLYVYAEAQRQRLRPDRIDWNSPPDWARARPRGAAALVPAASAPGPRGRRMISTGIK